MHLHGEDGRAIAEHCLSAQPVAIAHTCNGLELKKPEIFMARQILDGLTISSPAGSQQE